MPLILLAGVATHEIAYAAVASGAALCVGFGAARDLRGRRWDAMIAAAAGTSLTAFLGCFGGQWPPLAMALAAVAAMSCAVMALVDEDLWWVSLQMVIALLVASYYPGPLPAALLRSGVVLAGGAVQIAVVVLLARLAPGAAARLPAPARKEASPPRLYVAHALRAAICVCLSLWLARRLGLINGYWAPMTAMLVLKPGLSETNTRGVARVTGTVAGCVAASLFGGLAGDSWPLLTAGVGIAATAAFALQKAHYAILTSAITATVVLLLVMAQGGHVLANAEHRLIATVLGGAMALVLARIIPHSPHAARPATDRVGAAPPA